MDNSDQINFDLNEQELLLTRSLDLLSCIINVCSHRIHGHAKRIISFLVRLIYLASWADTQNKVATNNVEELYLIKRIVKLLKQLFENKIIKQNFYDEFKDLQTSHKSNTAFIHIINTI